MNMEEMLAQAQKAAETIQKQMGDAQAKLDEIEVEGTAGGGLYHEEGRGLTESNAGTNAGGGVKIAIAGPIRVRVDYRVFKLRGSPEHATLQRVYAGVNIGF